jgi:hypothetical protein
MLTLNHLMHQSLNAFHRICSLRRNHSLKKPTPRPTPEIEIKSKAVKRKCRLGSKTSRSSTISTSSSVTKVDDAQGESKIEVMQSSVSRINELMYDADNPQSPNAVKDDVPEERGMAALPTQVR